MYARSKKIPKALVKIPGNAIASRVGARSRIYPGPAGAHDILIRKVGLDQLRLRRWTPKKTGSLSSPTNVVRLSMPADPTPLCTLGHRVDALEFPPGLDCDGRWMTD
jgi:hypothetical protein